MESSSRFTASSPFKAAHLSSIWAHVSQSWKFWLSPQHFQFQRFLDGKKPGKILETLDGSCPTKKKVIGKMVEWYKVVILG